MLLLSCKNALFSMSVLQVSLSTVSKNKVISLIEKVKKYHKGMLQCDAPYGGHLTKFFVKLSANQDV